MQEPTFSAGVLDMRRDPGARGFIDDGPHIGVQVPRRVHAQRVHRALQHGQQPLGDVVLNIETAQRGTALTGGLEGGFHNGLHGLFRQGRAIDNHGVKAAGFSDERRARSEVRGHTRTNFECGLRRPGEGHTVHARIRGEGRANIPATGQQLQRAPRHARFVQQANG